MKKGEVTAGFLWELIQRIIELLGVVALIGISAGLFYGLFLHEPSSPLTNDFNRFMEEIKSLKPDSCIEVPHEGYYYEVRLFASDNAPCNGKVCLCIASERGGDPVKCESVPNTSLCDGGSKLCMNKGFDEAKSLWVEPQTAVEFCAVKNHVTIST
jgi:hypothetical protein